MAIQTPVKYDSTNLKHELFSATDTVDIVNIPQIPITGSVSGTDLILSANGSTNSPISLAAAVSNAETFNTAGAGIAVSGAKNRTIAIAPDPASDLAITVSALGLKVFGPTVSMNNSSNTMTVNVGSQSANQPVITTLDLSITGGNDLKIDVNGVTDTLPVAGLINTLELANVAGAGIAVSGTKNRTIAIDTTGAASGQVIAFNGTSPIWKSQGSVPFRVSGPSGTGGSSSQPNSFDNILVTDSIQHIGKIISGGAVGDTPQSQLDVVGSYGAGFNFGSSSYTMTDTDHTYIYTGTGGHVITLPSASTSKRRLVRIQNKSDPNLNVGLTISPAFQLAHSNSTRNVLQCGESVLLQAGDGAAAGAWYRVDDEPSYLRNVIHVVGHLSGSATQRTGSFGQGYTLANGKTFTTLTEAYVWAAGNLSPSSNNPITIEIWGATQETGQLQLNSAFNNIYVHINSGASINWTSGSGVGLQATSGQVIFISATDNSYPNMTFSSGYLVGLNALTGTTINATNIHTKMNLRSSYHFYSDNGVINMENCRTTAGTAGTAGYEVGAFVTAASGILRLRNCYLNTSGNGIRAQSSGSVSCRNTVIINGENGLSDYESAVYGTGGSSVEIHGCHLTSYHNAGTPATRRGVILLDTGSALVRITNSSIISVGGNGVALDAGTSLDNTKIFISGNYIESSAVGKGVIGIGGTPTGFQFHNNTIKGGTTNVGFAIPTMNGSNSIF